ACAGARFVLAPADRGFELLDGAGELEVAVSAIARAARKLLEVTLIPDAKVRLGILRHGLGDGGEARGTFFIAGRRIVSGKHRDRKVVLSLVRIVRRDA